MKNRAVSGGGAYCSTNTQAALVNCTFSENLGYGLVCSSSTPTVTNCILWGDTPEEIYPPPSIGITTVTYCDVQGSYPGTGNFDVAPFAFEGDYHLAQARRALTRAPTVPPGVCRIRITTATRALDGNGDGEAVVDLGVQEFIPTAPTIVLNPSQIEFHLLDGQSEATQVLSIRNAGGGTLHWTLEFRRGVAERRAHER